MAIKFRQGASRCIIPIAAYTPFPDSMKVVSLMTFDDVGCDYGHMIEVVCKDGASFVGVFVDLEIDYDGSYGGDSVGIELEDGHYLSFMEEDIQEINPV